MLLALLTAQRAQTLSLLSVDGLSFSEDVCQFVVDKALKTEGPGAVIKIKAYQEDTNICAVHLLKQYLEVTQTTR